MVNFYESPEKRPKPNSKETLILKCSRFKSNYIPLGPNRVHQQPANLCYWNWLAWDRVRAKW